MLTHFIAYDTPTHRGVARARCGLIVSAASHASEPACLECAALVATDNAQTADELFGSHPPGTPVRSTWGDPLKDYRPRGSR